MPGLLEILPEYVLHWIVQRGKERHLGEQEPLLTEADMNQLFEHSAFGEPCSKIQFEALGINLFAECSRD